MDNIIRPLLLRNRTQLNPLLLFIGVLGGLSVFGLLGLVVGPAIVAAAMGVFRVHMAASRRCGGGAIVSRREDQSDDQSMRSR